ncbi:MAG: hypothetical protein ABI639_03210 [Thermoanaerobaculia bacterium]
MKDRKRWIAPSLAVVALAAAAGLAYAAASEEVAAGGIAAAGDAASSGGSEASPIRHSKIRLIVDHDGSAEQIALTDLHEMAVGESRTLATESGTPVVVSRDDEGFEIDVDGRKIRLDEHFSTDGLNLLADGGTKQFTRHIVLRDGDGESDHDGNVMIVRNRVVSGSDVAAVAGDGSDRHVVVIRKGGPGAPGEHAFAFATGGSELPAIPLPVEATIHRLEASAKFQELDAATRAKVLEALRESAPKLGAFTVGDAGSGAVVVEVDDDSDGDAN